MGLPDPPALGASAVPAGTFDGQTVIVTGGGTGLGKAIAVEFARVGAKLAILSRGEEHRAAGLAAVEAVGAKAIAIGCDIRDPEAIASAFEAVTNQLGPADVLVNNAAGNFPVPAEDMSPRAWRAVVQIVLDGTFFCSSEFARRRIARRQGGSILNIGATYVWTGGPGHSHSAAAKAGVLNLTQSLAVEWAPDDIRVNCLTPGFFPAPDRSRSFVQGPAQIARTARTIPGGRVGEAHELGYAATYMCSVFAAYLTGHNIVLDGGNWLRRNRRMPEFEPVRDVFARERASREA